MAFRFEKHGLRFCSSRAAMRVSALVCSCVLAVVLAFPVAAYGTYADYDTVHPAFQNIGTYGEAIYAADIPDGVYEVEARTDSSMCILYQNAEDVEPRTNKERAYIQVNNGSMTALFYTSRMYTRLYFGGDGALAASLTNADGSDDSNYLAGNPPDGYVPHYYAVSIPALNYPMDFASFAGGEYPISSDPSSSWHTRAKWYSHFVVFKPTAEVMNAIEQARSSASGDNGQTPSQADTPTDPQDGQKQPDDNNPGVPGAPKASSEQKPQNNSSAAAAATVSGPAAASGGSAKKGVAVLSPAQFDIDGSPNGGQADIPMAQQNADDSDMMPFIVCGIAMALLTTAGIAWRFGAFNLSKSKPKEGTEDVS